MTTNVVTAEVIDALAKRVEQLEQQVSQVKNAVHGHQPKLDTMFVDNELLAREFRAFLDAQGITGEPIGAEELRKMIGVNEQNPNEFSRGIIAMREE